MEFKLSPLILFVILLVVLAMSSMWKTYSDKEGFITYNKNGGLFSQNTLGIYSSANPVSKIYDDIYYDPRNGNIVVVYTKDQYTTESSTDSEGKNIMSIDIVPRNNNSAKNNNVSSYTNENLKKSIPEAVAVSQITTESQKSTLDAIDVAWSFKSKTSQVNYFTWGSNTYIYVMDITNLEIHGNSITDTASQFNNHMTGNNNSYAGTVKHMSAAYYTGAINPGITMDFNGADGDQVEDIYLNPSYPTQSTDGYDDKSVVEPFYHPSRTVYQITSKIKFDIGNGNLLIVKTPTSGDKSLDIFYRADTERREDDSTPNITNIGVQDAQASSADYITHSFNKSVSKPFFVQDFTNQNTVMYWPSGENTLIAVFENRVSNGYIPLKKVVRFTSSGVYTTPDTTPAPVTPPVIAGNTVAGGHDISGGNYGDFWKWWSYFNTNAVGGISNDYMLKTQIVPPVCPSCPACSGGACTNCGGSGGSGSMGPDGSSLAIKGVSDVKGPSSAAASLGQSAGATVRDTAAVAGLTAIGTGALATGVLNNTVNTAGNIVNKTFDTAGNVVNKTFDTAGNIINTTGGLLQSAGTGVSNLFTSDPRRVGYEQSYNGPRPGSNNTGIYNPGPTQGPTQGPAQGQMQGPASNIDPYTYNGALQSKGANFRSMTTDFSAFGR